MLVKAEHGARGANPRYVLTNLSGAPQRLYERVYCARGDMENRIKEQQLDLFADRTSCHRWWANQFRLLLASAYPYQDLFCLVAARLRPGKRPILAPPTHPAPGGEAAPRIDPGQPPFRRQGKPLSHPENRPSDPVSPKTLAPPSLTGQKNDHIASLVQHSG